jgi:hypothetical protein
MPRETPSPEEAAVSAGYWRVSLPGWLIMMGLMWPPILYLGPERGMATPTGLKVIGGFIVAAFVAAWLWWSFAAPRWRRWAYRRVSDLQLLEELAVAGNLVWRASHPLTRTELRFGRLGAELRAREEAAGLTAAAKAGRTSS